MRLIQGSGISNGIAIGPICFLQQSSPVVTNVRSDPGTEYVRLATAQQKTITQLHALAGQCRAQNGDETALLFETHAMLVEDEDYTACIHNCLEAEKCTAEYAVYTAGEQFAAIFSAMDDPYMQARADDIRDISRRLLRNLMGCSDHPPAFDVPVILAADDLSPSETVRLDKAKIMGIAIRKGSGSSHTAILARTMGIPAICALEELGPDCNGLAACMDGETGHLYLDPNEETIQAMKEKLSRQLEIKQHLLAMKGLDDITPDGQRISLFCNISTPDDVPAVLEHGAQGIGLFRSESLFLAAADYPTEEEQFQAYKTVAAAMEGKRVIIRTLDIGADKQAGYFSLKQEENPALGKRAIRLCLERPELFSTQLRALYRASAYGNIAIMFPMITSVWEVRECRRLCREVMAELEQAGIPFSRDTEIGIMIETPAAVFIADELAREVDFFSVGTNDLTQYILACDRQNNDLGRFFDPRHPAVLRAIKSAADAAHHAGIRIGICGELGADPELLPAFLAMGIDELSVAPSAVLPLRSAIRNHTTEKD